MNQELPDVQAGFRKGTRTRDQIANIRWIIQKAREFQKNIYFCFIDNAKAFDCVDHNKLWKIFREMKIPYHLIRLLRNLYASPKPQLELDMEQQTGSKLGKEYVAYEYFTKKFTRVDANGGIDFEVDVEGMAIFSIYPVVDNFFWNSLAFSMIQQMLAI